MVSKNWKQFFLNSLKSNVPITKDNLYINEKRRKISGGGHTSSGKIQIISPTAQATNQARETVRSKIINPAQLQRIERVIRKPRIKKTKTNKISSSGKKRKVTKKSVPKRKYKK